LVEKNSDLMPTIEISLRDLEELIRRKLSRKIEKLNELFSFVKGEIEELEGEQARVELKDSNRPDLWCIEGIARALRGALGIEVGIPRYKLKGRLLDVKVDRRLGKLRPYIACSVVKGVKLSDGVIKGFMQMQDKLDLGYGRGRRKTSIGLYDWDLISPPIHYTISRPEETSFIPLGFDKELTLKEILRVHPKGIDYGEIVRGFKLYPLLKDSGDKVLSFPPIINSEDLGRIKKETRNILIEVTGTDLQAVLNVLNIVTLNIADRGGEIYQARIIYPTKRVLTPKWKLKEIELDLSKVSSILGFGLGKDKIVKLLRRARFQPIAGKKNLRVVAPCYRIDLLHPIDLIEDIAILYGYDKIKPKEPSLATKGRASSLEELSDEIRELMLGFGAQEILTFTLTNQVKLFDKMNLRRGAIVEVENPRTASYTCLRNWLTPSLIEFLSNNTHAEYPQMIFEVGDCIRLERGEIVEERKVAFLTAHSNASFSEVKSVLDALFASFGAKCKLREVNHQSFIPGRVAKILIEGKPVGIVGEIHPLVLENWKIENPVAGFELSIEVIKWKK
jgi:phenylalanyl-tRNA synthetase beta chain